MTSSHTARHRQRGIPALIALAVLAVFVAATPSVAYERYNDGCQSCHGSFTGGTSPKSPPTVFPGNDKHRMHRSASYMNAECDLCHSTGDGNDPFIGSSDGTPNNPGLGCTGCHEARGLRLHHTNAGESGCVSCHGSEPAPPPESTSPPYYGVAADSNVAEPCNPVAQANLNENWSEGDFLGQDNDGDGLYDGADPDCQAAECGNGVLEAGEDCDDGNIADGDCCSSTCAFESAGSPCDDGAFCNAGETCDGTGTCGGGSARDCGDGVSCTVDSCDESADTCIHAPDDANCDDGTFCNGPEVCDPVQDCIAGTPVDCDDADVCTNDSCNEIADVCDNVFDSTNAPECAVCGNGVLDPGEDCDDGNTVDGDCCSSVCAFEPSGSPCDDGLYCNAGETCDGAGACGGGAARDCGDGVGCTSDSCDEVADSCVNTPSDAACDDGLFCTGVESCDPVQDCQPGTPVDCDDADICTDDSCNDTTDVCDNVFNPDNAPECQGELCGNGVVETGEDCDDGNTVNGDCCSSTCAFEGAGSPCDDGVFCNAGETCDGVGTCGGGLLRDCDDGVGCTADSCDETADACLNVPDDAACDDGLYCNGPETCDATQDCQGGTPVDCDDSDVCTDDSCDETSDACRNVFDPFNAPGCGTCGNGVVEPGEDCDDGNTADGDCCSSACTHEPAGQPCNDGLYCNAGEACDGAGTCAGGGPRDCGDGVGCTADSCDENADACVNAPEDASCDDGLYCNGTETCDAAQDCQAGTPVDCDDGDVCTDDACNETEDRCDNVFDATNAPDCLCVDEDGDGFFPAGGACGPFDCDDADPALPGAAEICGDHKDNDCNGFVDAADTACDASGDWTVRPGPLVNSQYTGSQVCGTCHAERFASWRESLHARLLIAPGDAQAAGFSLPDAESVPGADVSLRTWHDVLFVVGQKWKTQYVDRDGNVQGIQWNFAQGGWEAQPAGPYDCGRCHTTGFDASATYLDGGDRPVPGIAGSWVEFNVGCEACHGPGAEHAAAPRSDNINRIELDWTSEGEGIRTPAIRAAEVCGQCHYGGSAHYGIADSGRRNHEQFNDWSVSAHASSLQPSGLNTYCAKCHSPGNADAFAEEHYFEGFDPADATQVACISCHDPHAVSHPRWGALAWPAEGRQSPRDYPAALGRYRGNDGDPSTPDHQPFDNAAGSSLCTDCHTLQPGFRRHTDASPPALVRLEPPFNLGMPFVVPHGEHFTPDGEGEEADAECVDCHMPYSRRSANLADVRTHSLLPNEEAVGGSLHFDETCGQCHEQARDCVWCHAEFDPDGASGEGPGGVDPGWTRKRFGSGPAARILKRWRERRGEVRD